MSGEQRIKDAEKALGSEAEDYEIDYDDTPDVTESGRPQLILLGDFVERKTIEKLKSAGFEFLYAQSSDEELDEDDDDEEEDGADDEDEDIDQTEAEIESDGDDESFGLIEVAFEDSRAKSIM